MRVILEDSIYYLPLNKVTNSDFSNENPSWYMDRVQAQSGLYARYIAVENETALDLSIVASKNRYLSIVNLQIK